MRTRKLGNTQQQSGAALVISLILLLVMTMVGVSAMNGARLEINMASLMQQEEAALRRAERTLDFGEDHVEAIVTTAGQFQFGSDNDGYYLITDAVDASVADWSKLNPIAGPESDGDLSSDNDDSLVVEYLGLRAVSGESEKDQGGAPIAGGYAHVYRITARSATGAKAVRIVQSMYTTMQAP